ncbi:MAG: hypothetical protein SOW18_02000 [Peptoniphilus sp.]|nr:hypothetical protein [Peptoniphilus sp.]MDY3118292.1 hypothetical protein [Peptoniphilus sp.]
MDPRSIRDYRRLERDMVRAERAYVRALMEALDKKNGSDLRHLEEIQSRFEKAIEEFKIAIRDGK